MTYLFEDYLRHSFGFPSPNYAGAFFSALLAFVIPYFAARTRDTFKYVGSLLLITPLSICLGLTMSRGSAIALLLSLVVGGILIFLKLGTDSHKTRLYLLVVFTIILSSLAYGFGKRASLDFNVRDDSVLNRFSYWGNALKAHAASPLSGWGYGKSGEIVSDLSPVDLKRPEILTPVNGVLTILVDFGIFAFFPVIVIALYLPISSFLSFGSERILTVNRIAMSCCTLSLAISNLTSTLGESIVLNWLYILLTLLTIGILTKDIISGDFVPIGITTVLAAATSISVFVLGKNSDGVSISRSESGSLRFLENSERSKTVLKSVYLVDPLQSKSSALRQGIEVLHHSKIRMNLVVIDNVSQVSELTGQKFDVCFVSGEWVNVDLSRLNSSYRFSSGDTVEIADICDSITDRITK
jgi:hypothetical protein